MVEVKLPDGYMVVKRWQVWATLTGIALIVLQLAAILVLVVPQIGTNTDQNANIARLTQANHDGLVRSREASLQGCNSTNKLKEQSNNRIPAERIELQTALETALIIAHYKIPAPGGITVDPVKVKELLDGLETVGLRDCQAVYGGGK